MNNKRNDKKKYLIALLALVFVVGGTSAWLTSESNLTNEFTVGQINPIDPGENGPGDPEKPIDPEDPNFGNKLNGNLYEPSWVPSSKIFPSAEIEKDPYVGIGDKSEKSYVYVYVNNNMPGVFFNINTGWEVVTATKFDGKNDKAGDEAYTSGLFRYHEVLADTTEEKRNIWTGTPLFSTVIADDETNAANFKTPTIEVKSFVHQAEDGEGNDLQATADAAAKEIFKIN